MKTTVAGTSTLKPRQSLLAVTGRARLLAILEVVLVCAAVQALLQFWKSLAITRWELRNLGWSYSGMLVLVGVPALITWLARRSPAEYGLSLANWPTNLDIGIKAYVLSFIPLAVGVLGAQSLGLDYLRLRGGAFVAATQLVAVALMIRILNRHKPVQSGRKNLIVTLLLLCFPIGLALALRSFNGIMLSTLFWQFVFSGFGEEFVFRGYVQSRLNAAFGRPLRWFGIQFGPGLIIASLLFGLLHAFNTFEPAVGLSSMAWGWALWTFVSGLFFGVIREKTGTLVGPGIAHGLPDAVGEVLKQIGG